VLGEVLVPDACRAHLAPTVLPIPLHQQPAVTLQPRGTRCGAVTAWPLGAWRSRCHNDFPRLSLSLCTMACGDKELNRLRVTATRSRPDASAIHGRCGARVSLLQSPVPRTVLPTSVQARREETRFRLDRSTQRRPLESLNPERCCEQVKFFRQPFFPRRTHRAVFRIGQKPPPAARKR